MNNAKKHTRKPWGLIAMAIFVAVFAITVAVLLIVGGPAGGHGDATQPNSTTQAQPSDSTGTAEDTPGSPADSTGAGNQSDPTDSKENPADTTTAPSGSDGATQNTQNNGGSAATTAPSEQNTQKPTEPSATTAPTEPQEGDKEDPTSVKTPYGTLNFPKEWSEYLAVEVMEGDPYQVAYIADLGGDKRHTLFVLNFGGDAETAAAFVNVNGSKVPLHLSGVDSPFGSDWTDSEINMVATMQEALNDVLSGLNLELNLGPDSSIPVENGEDMVIDAPCGELHYPSRWKDNLSLQMADDYVAFYGRVGGHSEQWLFTVHFGTGVGIEIGSVTDVGGQIVSVSVEIEDLMLDDSWSTNDASVIYAMQEDLNYLLMNLS